MSLKELAEGIILQSMEDLYDGDERQDCISLFKGKDFTICAEMAGIDMPSQTRLLHLVKRMITASGVRSLQISNIAEVDMISLTRYGA